MRMRLMWLVVMALVAIPASAQTFVKETDSIQAGGDLVASWKENGLAPSQNVTYTLKADATFQYACVSGSKKSPAVADQMSAGGAGYSNTFTFTASKGGSISAMLALVPENADLVETSCPSGSKPVLASVTYVNVTLSDGLGHVGVLDNLSAVYYTL